MAKKDLELLKHEDRRQLMLIAYFFATNTFSDGDYYYKKIKNIFYVNSLTFAIFPIDFGNF
jgi:hypothetical protein